MHLPISFIKIRQHHVHTVYKFSFWKPFFLILNRNNRKKEILFIFISIFLHHENRKNRFELKKSLSDTHRLKHFLTGRLHRIPIYNKDSIKPHNRIFRNFKWIYFFFYWNWFDFYAANSFIFSFLLCNI